MTPGSRGYLRTIGIDDGYFPIWFKERRFKTLLVGILCDGLAPVDVKAAEITVDGFDGSKAALTILEKLIPRSGGVKAIFIDGVTSAGFNVIDPDEIFQSIKVPVIVVFKHNLKMDKVEKALRRHFRDWGERYSVIDKVYRRSKEVITRWRRLRLSCVGINCYEASALVSNLQTVSPYPEPLRLSDMIASGLTRNSRLLELINKGRREERQGCVKSSSFSEAY
ncbi:MAG: DUF99 family protein [Desulfurococcales archaeon]|nr:DUF99 family protein [Desulfurococcales archaeon]